MYIPEENPVPSATDSKINLLHGKIMLAGITRFVIILLSVMVGAFVFRDCWNNALVTLFHAPRIFYSQAGALLLMVIVLCYLGSWAAAGAALSAQTVHIETLELKLLLLKETKTRDQEKTAAENGTNGTEN